MISSFAIQASNPRVLMVLDPAVENLSDAIEAVFPLETEYALLTWNWVYVPFSYKYDLSLMVDDIVNLLEVMAFQEAGQRTIRWPSNTFAATWNVEWAHGEVVINAKWECVLGGTEALLAQKPTVTSTAVQFVREWRRPLEVTLSALERAGYTEKNLPGLSRMQNIVKGIEGTGILYTDGTGR